MSVLPRPDRVVIHSTGEATTPERAEEMGIKPVVIYVRNDGWALGAPAEFAHIAKEMWADCWVKEIRLEEGVV